MFANYPLMQFENHSTSLEMALYASLSRIAWALALSYIIFACVHGYGGPVNWFLSLSLWQPLSRLSYSIYIIHFPVIVVVMASAKTSFYMDEFHAVRNHNNWKTIVLHSIVIYNVFLLSLLTVSLFPGQLCAVGSRSNGGITSVRITNRNHRENDIRRCEKERTTQWTATKGGGTEWECLENSNDLPTYKYLYRYIYRK